MSIRLGLAEAAGWVSADKQLSRTDVANPSEATAVARMLRRSISVMSARVLGDERLHHVARAVGLRSRRGDPLVLAAFEQLILDVAAGSFVGLRALLLNRREHVVVERALHDEERDPGDGLVALENLMRITFVDR